MMQDPEDDRLDQSLRDTFSDFDLPPSGHVWSGIEGQLSAIPGPPRQVPLLLLLPAVGLVGVAVGWLLPHPTATPTLKPQPTITAQAAVQPSELPAQKPTVAYSVPPVSAGPSAARLVAANSNALAKRVKPVATPKASQTSRAAVVQPPSDSVVLAADMSPQPAAPTEVAILVPAASEVASPHPSSGSQAEVSTATPPAAEATGVPLRDTAGAMYATHAAEPSKQNFKNESIREWRPEYRTPKHRLEERGNRLRRIRNSITKHWQHLFQSRRTGPPAS